MTHRRISNNLRGLIYQQAALRKNIMEKEKGGFETGLRGIRMKLTNVDNLLTAMENGNPKGADPMYWKRLQEHSKLVGYRGEYAVVAFLRKRRWFAKRSFGSWGVDVFAGRGRYIKLDGEEVTPIKGVWKFENLLIDVKSSEREYPLLGKIPHDEKTLTESRRTGIPYIRAACLKGATPPIKWYWQDGREIPESWFD